MGTTIRVSREDKERLTNLAKSLKAKSMVEALRRVVAIAEENDDIPCVFRRAWEKDISCRLRIVVVDIARRLPASNQWRGKDRAARV